MLFQKAPHMIVTADVLLLANGTDKLLLADGTDMLLLAST